MSLEGPCRNGYAGLLLFGRVSFVARFGDEVAEQFGIDCAVVNVFESDPALVDPEQLDDVADQIGGSLLPEGFLAAAEELIHQRSDGVRQRVRVHPVRIEGVPLPVAIEAKLDVVVASAVFLQHVMDGVAEVAFDFQHEAGSLVVGVVGLPGEELFGEGLHTGGGLAGTHGSDDGEAGEEALLREHQPAGLFRFDRLGGVMGFTDDERD